MAYSELLDAGESERRFAVFAALWRAGTEAVGNWSRLWKAVLDLRHVLPERDPARCAPVGSHPTNLRDDRDGPSLLLAQRVIARLEPLPKTTTALEARLPEGTDVDAEPVPVEIAERIRATRSLGELAETSQQRLFGSGSGPAGGWPVYVAPWNSEHRECAAVRLLARAGEPDAREKTRRWGAGGAAALVLLERAFGGDPEGWQTWGSLTDLRRRLPSAEARALEDALHATQPTLEITAALGCACRGEAYLPQLNETAVAIAEIVFTDGPLMAKEIAARMPEHLQTGEQNIRRIFSEKLMPHYGFSNPRNGTGYRAPQSPTWR